MTIPDISKVTEVANILKNINLELLELSKRLNLSLEDLNQFKTVGKKLQNVEKEFENFKGKGIKQGEELNKLNKEFQKAREKLLATDKLANASKKANDLTERIHKALFAKVPGSNFLDSASRVGGILGILSAIGLVFFIKLQEQISNRIFDNLDAINKSGSDALTTLNVVKNRVVLAEQKIKKVELDLNANAKDYYQLNKQQESFGKSITEAKQKINDVTYETREGRKIIEGKVSEAKKQANDALYETRQTKLNLDSKITEAKKQANDALYETRQTKLNLDSKITEAKKQANDIAYETREGRKILESKLSEQRTSFDAKIQLINAQISKFTSGVSDSFQKSVNTTIAKLQADLAVVKLNQAAIKPATPADVAAITANAVAAAKAETRVALSQVSALQSVVSGLGVQTAAALSLGGTAISSVSNLAQGVSNASNTANQALNESRSRAAANMGTMQQQLNEKFAQTVAQNAKDLKIRDLQLSDLSKEFDKRNENFFRQLTLTGDQRYKEFIDENNKALKIRDLQLSDLSKEFDKRNENFFAQSTKTSQQIYDEFVEQNKASVATIKSEVTVVKTDIKTNEADIAKIDTKLKEQEKINALALPKLDQILGILPFIPARAADAIRPSIPTPADITTATGTAICNSTNGGCLGRGLSDAANNVNNNTNNRIGNALDAINTGANAALLAGQQTILQRLGDQLPGGLSGKLQRFSQWLHLDRALNLMIWATTIHNAAMLSNNLGQTLLSLLNNILSAVGLKNSEGEAFDIGSVISAGIESTIKAIVGEENYTALNAAWKKANRIYQAAANLLNSIQSIGASVLNALEVVGQWNAKVGNALKRFGAVGEKAYEWMNPNVNFQNKYFTALENVTNVVSQLDQVASEVLSIKETVGQITEQKKELDDSLSQSDSGKQKTNLPAAEKLAEKEKEAKEASAAKVLNESDKEADEDEN